MINLFLGVGHEKRKSDCPIIWGGGFYNLFSRGKKKGYEIYGLTIQYGQRHKIEIKAARRVAKFFGIKQHLELEVPLKAFGGSALTDIKIKVPKKRNLQDMGKRIPPTYVPARNTVFLSLALAWAEVLGAEHLFIGVNALDYSGYPDCRPEFIKIF